MVLGILTAIAACPAIVGTNEAIQMTQRNQMKQMHRERKTNLVISCNDQSPQASEVDGHLVVLRDHKVSDMKSFWL
jgi:hypothetical protein